MLDELVLGRTNNTAVQLFRYTFVGGAAFLCDFGTLFLLTHFLHIHYLTSAAAGFLVGLAVNYLLSVAWVFDRSSYDSRMVEFLLFLLIGLVGLGLNELIIWLCTDKFGIHYLLSKVASTGGVYFWNFFVRKYALFR